MVLAGTVEGGAVGHLAVEEIQPLPRWTGYCPKQREQKGKLPWHLLSFPSSLLPAPSIGRTYQHPESNGSSALWYLEKPNKQGKQEGSGPVQFLVFFQLFPNY